MLLSIKHRENSPTMGKEEQNVIFLWQTPEGKKELRSMVVTMHHTNHAGFGENEPISMDYDAGDMFVPYYPCDLCGYDLGIIIEDCANEHEVLREPYKGNLKKRNKLHFKNYIVRLGIKLKKILSAPIDLAWEAEKQARFGCRNITIFETIS